MAVARALELGCIGDRLRLDRQRRHRDRLAGRQGRPAALHLLSGEPRAGEGAQRPRSRRRGLPGRRQLRRGEPRLPRAGRSDSGLQFSNITLRPFYAEGAKTLAFEVVEQLGWASPDHIVMPAAGGTLSSRVHKGLEELREGRPRRDRADQAPHRPARSAARRSRPRSPARAPEIVPQVPETLAHSLAIGAPGDGSLVVDAVRGRGGSRRRRPRRRDHHRDGAAGGDRGGPHRAGRRNHGRGDDEARPGGRPAVPTTRSIIVISGNGLKTLSEQPIRPWPENVPCNAGAMEEVVNEFRQRRRRCPRPLGRCAERPARGRGCQPPLGPGARARLPRRRSGGGGRRRPLPPRLAAALVRVAPPDAGAGRPATGCWRWTCAGFGWSDAPRDGYEKENMADDVLAVLDELGIEKVKLVGHDWGGWIGFLLGIRAPERFDRYLALNILHPWISRRSRRAAPLALLVPAGDPHAGARLPPPHAAAASSARSSSAPPSTRASGTSGR